MQSLYEVNGILAQFCKSPHRRQSVGHEHRGTDAVPDNVTEDERLTTVWQCQDIVEVATNL